MMILHTFKMGDVEDPDLFASFTIGEWQQTEKGKWVMENAIEPPVYYIDPDLHINMGYRVWIEGKFSPEVETYFRLKYE